MSLLLFLIKSYFKIQLIFLNINILKIVRIFKIIICEEENYKKGEFILLRRLSICTVLTAFIFTLFTFNGSAFAATNATENQNVVAACAKGGTVGVYGAKDAQWLYCRFTCLTYI